MKRRALSIAMLLAAPLMLGLSQHAAAQTYAIVNAHVAPGTGGADIENGTVLIENGRIAAVGANIVAPTRAQTVDAHGGWVTPGIFAGLANIGVNEVFEGVRETNDARAETSVFNAALDLSTAVNPRSIHFAINRVAGVTRAAIAPENGKSIFAGQGALIDLGSPDPVTRARAFQYVDLSQSGGRIAGGSRPAAFAEFREALHDAAEYARNPAAFVGGRERTSILPRRDAEALVPVVQGRQLLLVEVERAQDIRMVIALRREFPALRLVLVGCAEGWLVANEIAAAHVPVITTALADLPESFDQLAATQSNVGRLVRAGVTVALSGYGSGTDIQPRKLPEDAGNLVALSRIPGAAGLTHAQAMATITSAPAQIFGTPTLGSLAPGKTADVVIWSGDPLELASAPVAVFIDGRPQPMVSRQTELRDRYLGLQRGDLTLRYKR